MTSLFDSSVFSETWRSDGMPLPGGKQMTFTWTPSDYVILAELLVPPAFDLKSVKIGLATHTAQVSEMPEVSPDPGGFHGAVAHYTGTFLRLGVYPNVNIEVVLENPKWLAHDNAYGQVQGSVSKVQASPMAHIAWRYARG